MILPLVVSLENVGIADSLSYEELSVEILDSQVYQLRTKDVVLVKFPWRNNNLKMFLGNLKRT